MKRRDGTFDKEMKNASLPLYLKGAGETDAGAGPSPDPAGALPGTAEGDAASAAPAKLPIGRDEISAAVETALKYQRGKELLENRIRANEKFWRLDNWSNVSKEGENPTDPRPSSAWLFNSISNKHADAMDNFPQPDVLPRAADDKKDAATLSAVIPTILDNNRFEETYSRLWWDKLLYGGSICGIFWDPDRDDIAVDRVDPLTIYWQPGIRNIQDSKNVFIARYIPDEDLREMYPDADLHGKGGVSFTVREVEGEDKDDHTDESVVFDWYYKRGGLVHFCRFTDGCVLFSDENENAKSGGYPDGWYADGDYPFVFDVCFPLEYSPFGMGYVDVGRETQHYIDRLDGLIYKNALASARPRYFVRSDGGVNEDEFADTRKEIVHVSGNRLGDDSIRQITPTPLSDIYVSIAARKIDELKETTGNRDFSQGGTASGVTSGSAIAALQEAGNKLSRDINKGSYRAFADICYLIIERIRQFYTTQRTFRILGADGYEFVNYSNENISPDSASAGEMGVELGSRVPIFDIKVKAQKASPFSREIANQRAQEMFAQGWFNPAAAEQAMIALDMMDFEGIEEVRAKVAAQGQMYQQLQALQQQVAELGAMLGRATGIDPVGGESTEPSGRPASAPKRASGGASELDAAETVMKHGAVGRANTAAADAMRVRVRNGASPA